MRSSTPVTRTINFHSDKIEFAGDRISGDKYEVNNSTIDKMGFQGEFFDINRKELPIPTLTIQPNRSESTAVRSVILC